MEIISEGLTLVDVHDGEDGVNGVEGPKGEDGKTSYIHTAYATSADGSQGFSTSDSTNKTYLGQYTDFTQADSNDPTKYKWTKIKGDTGPQGPQGQDGENGEDGEDGQTYYTWLKYADTPTSGMSDSPDGKKYMGLAHNKTTATESTNYSDYTWSLITGDKGDPTGITSSSTVPTSPYAGMLWKNTGSITGYITGAVYRYTGSAWELFKFKANNIEADSLSAISANIGNVTAGNISGVNVTASSFTGSKFQSSGSYSDVTGQTTYTNTIENGNYTIKWNLASSTYNGLTTFGPRGLSSTFYSDTAGTKSEWSYQMTYQGLLYSSGQTYASFDYGGISMMQPSKTIQTLGYSDIRKVEPTKLTTFEAGFENYSASGTSMATYSRKHGFVQLTGAIKNTELLALGTSEVKMATLPAGFRPPRVVHCLQQGSGSNSYLMTVDAAGKIGLARYGTTAFVDVPAGSWLTISCVFSTDDD